MQSYDAERLFLRKGRGGWFWKVMYRAQGLPCRVMYRVRAYHAELCTGSRAYHAALCIQAFRAVAPAGEGGGGGARGATAPLGFPVFVFFLN